MGTRANGLGVYRTVIGQTTGQEEQLSRLKRYWPLFYIDDTLSCSTRRHADRFSNAQEDGNVSHIKFDSRRLSIKECRVNAAPTSDRRAIGDGFNKRSGG